MRTPLPKVITNRMCTLHFSDQSMSHSALWFLKVFLPRGENRGCLYHCILHLLTLYLAQGGAQIPCMSG